TSASATPIASRPRCNRPSCLLSKGRANCPETSAPPARAGTARACRSACDLGCLSTGMRRAIIATLRRKEGAMADSEAHATGRETRRQLMGDAMVDRMDHDAYDDPIMSDFVDYATEALWGLLWSRPGLD